MEAPRAALPARESKESRNIFPRERQGFVSSSETGNTQGWLYFYHHLGADDHKLSQEEIPIALIRFTYCNRSAWTPAPQGQLLIEKMH